MKKEALLALGLTEEQAAGVFELNGRDIEAAKARYADYEAVKQQLADANKAIEGFQGMDVDAIRKEAEGWKAKAEQAERDAAAKLADMEFNTRLTSAVTAAKGRNAKAIMALLDVDTLKASKNQEADVKAALEGLKRESAYLFEAEPEYIPPAGGAPNTVGSLRDAIAEKLSEAKE